MQGERADSRVSTQRLRPRWNVAYRQIGDLLSRRVCPHCSGPGPHPSAPPLVPLGSVSVVAHRISKVQSSTVSGAVSCTTALVFSPHTNCDAPVAVETTLCISQQKKKGALSPDPRSPTDVWHWAAGSRLSRRGCTLSPSCGTRVLKPARLCGWKAGGKQRTGFHQLRKTSRSANSPSGSANSPPTQKGPHLCGIRALMSVPRVAIAKGLACSHRLAQAARHGKGCDASTSKCHMFFVFNHSQQRHRHQARR